MKHIFKKSILALIMGTLCLTAQAQQVNTLYFLENSPMRHYINPALQPISNMYLSLPLIGYSSAWVGNNSLSMRDVLYTQNGQTMWFLNPQTNTQQFFKHLHKSTLIDADAQANLLSFGFRIKDAGYFHFTLNERLNGGAALPKGLFNFALGGGMHDLNGGINTFDLKQLRAELSLYTELGLGYSHQINEHWAVGGKIKFLYGSMFMGMTNKALALNASSEEWNLRGNGAMMMAAPLNQYPASIAPDDMSNTNWEMNMDILNLLKPQGLGAAIDLGVTYKPIEMLQITASVTDLGFINWYKGREYNYDINGTYDGVGEIVYSEYIDADGNFNSQALGDTIVERLENIYNTAVQPTKQSDGFTRMISPRINIGVDANFWDNRVGIGVYSRTKFLNTRAYEELTFGAAFRPCHWFQIAASYSVINGRGGNIGAALGLVTGEGIGLTLAADYIPCYYAHYEYVNKDGEPKTAPIPYKTNGINIAFGLNIVIGHKKDKDKDGVIDKYDLCPSTPKGVKVDEFGCPIDTDGDGVPDYLDECPNTPTEAYGLVDEKGCPIDTDGDGVPDYLDLCPHTPEAAYGFVDDKGCPLDTDGDGVPDYLDECPGTPAAARGFVDDKGCLLDTDGDAVPDYLDQCPDTPEAAYGFVDDKGCPLDTDGDGVPDYLDECPDTPEAAYGFIDEKGCPLDTDGDGVPDYLDQCPTVPGDKENNGCPVVKREIRNLLQKAMQGIQFETGKAVIKKNSYSILNQIAQTFIENPTYHVEVQGHTDNVGKAAMNKDLSERRAQAVRRHLIDAGVPENQLEAHGYGDTMPIADNKTAKGRALNRRVEFAISFEEVTYEDVYTTNDADATAETEAPTLSEPNNAE
ncbi:MAG: DUF5723 family protein [Paludibacter sp.]|nr:DUF5723 family protein [Bacteroidales bacterium]MCM1068989.1 DUF5723 family protein [Prevotella sp.]MCM1353652.1 DUF5723 family protein [Bacteroides sp.]MCM1441999.1 DUF5723 family protein [Muribaculum sp.]MCM1481545.1 DUF5723 family protein [Paludibacter sp.]